MTFVKLFQSSVNRGGTASGGEKGVPNTSRSHSRGGWNVEEKGKKKGVYSLNDGAEPPTAESSTGGGEG